MIKEGTNKAIAINSLLLQAKLIINLICGLFSTRFALQALGAEDYGLFSVVGGVISFIAIFNTIMLAASNRFIAVAIGKKDIKEANKQFNVNLTIHISIALFTLLIAYPIGDWYILNYINYEGNIQDAITVYNITIIGSIISFIGVPYQGLLTAKENFLTYSLVEIISQILKLVLCFLLLYFFNDKLLSYSIIITLTTTFPCFIYALYCNIIYKDIVDFRIIRDFSLYKDVCSFSIWTGIGAIASIGRAQGSFLIINSFFNTIMNTALGIANTINNILMQFIYTLTQPMQPQITKSYVSGDESRYLDLVIVSSKVAFSAMLIISTPFLIEAGFLLKLWLGEIPTYSIIFIKLLIIDGLIRSFNSGISTIVFATGKIKLYQTIESSLILLSVIIGYFVLNLGYDAYFFQIIIIIFSIITLAVRHIVLIYIVKINSLEIIKKSYIPSCILAILYIPALIIKIPFHPIFNIIVVISYTLLLIWIICLNHKEKSYTIFTLKNLSQKFIKNFHK
mgnify:CR=1 FL=1